MGIISSPEYFPCGAEALPEMEKIMYRITPVNSENADSKVAATLSQVKSRLGKVPNFLATLANAPAALDGFLSLSKSLSRGRLSTRQREILALAVAQENDCQYCLSAHTESATTLGLSPAEVLKAREGNSDDSFEHSLTRFAKNIIHQRGLVSDEDLDIARRAGIDDGLMLEVVANVALNTLSNYANRLADTEIDFAVVRVER
jgi:uncharacterized peroxidase-related enzyme